MSKLIIFCKHAVETLSYFSMQLARTFEKREYEIFWMDFDQLELSADQLKRKAADREAVLITFNFIGLSGEQQLWSFDGQGRPLGSIWEKLGIRCLNMMVDHPIYYYKALGYPQPDLNIFCIDRDHEAYMRRFYPKVSCEFLPLGGNLLLDENGQEGEESFEQWMKRPYPLIFTANYVPVSGIEQQFAGLDPEYRDFYYAILESLKENPRQELISCIEACLRREIPGISEEELCQAMQTMPAVDLWIRTYFREKTVRVLAEGGIPVYLFGKDWEQAACSSRENVICSGRMVNSADCVRAAAQAKIALNTMPWFKNGAHDRIFTAMLHNTAVLTDGSAYLKEQFGDGETIFYYDLCALEELPQQVNALLQEPERIYAVSCRGRAAASGQHTWEMRAQVMERYM